MSELTIPDDADGRAETNDTNHASRRLVAGALLLALLLCALMAYWLWVLRDHRLQFVTRQVLLQTSAASEQASVVLGMVDASLRETAIDLREGRIDAANAHRTLRLRLGAAPDVRALALTDREGRVLASSWPDLAPAVRSVPAPADAATLHIAAPGPSPYDGHEAIVLARSVAEPVAGMAQVVAEVDNHFVAAFFSRMVTALDARVGLFTLDGTQLGGTVDLDRIAPRRASNAALLNELLHASGAGAVTMGDAFIAAQRVEGLPLIVATTRDHDPALAPWRDSVVSAAIGTAAALALLGFMVWRLDRETRARVQAQGALARTRERTRLAFEAAQEGTWAWDAGHDGLELSPRMAELLGVAGTHIPQSALRCDPVHPDDRGLVDAALAAHLAGQTAQLGVQFRVATGAGTWRWVHVRGRALRDAEGRVQSVVGTASDESEARQRSEQLQELQSQLQRTRRLESLGRLAGGIAHDFNNILAAILGYGELMQQQAAPGSAAARHAEQIVRAGERGRSLVARILAFSRGGSRAHTPLVLEPVVIEALDLLAASLRPGVQLERELHAHDAVVVGDATQLFEAVSNLCANALHAMPEGGTLRVRVESLQTDSPRSLSHGVLAAGRHVCVSVSDTGVGMDRDVLEHLFEPFFTTRAPQVGTGLGLAMVHGAVKEMQGVIDVQSVPQRGSSFALYFSRVDVDADALPDPALLPAPAAAPLGAGQVVMVVDDEPALVALAEEALAGMGYEPVGFRDPAQALAALRAAPERFDAVLTDQIMPGMTGTELARAVQALRPGLPILLASGFGGARLDEQAADAGVTAVLQKPLRQGELAEQLARLFAVHTARADFI
jgi:PAS domain S-box-containing protein